MIIYLSGINTNLNKTTLNTIDLNDFFQIEYHIEIGYGSLKIVMNNINDQSIM